jgi:hypothetical protein
MTLAFSRHAVFFFVLATIPGGEWHAGRKCEERRI